MDSEYILLAFFLTLIGVTGVLLFNGPKTPSGDSCYCIIPSPEAGAMQGTSGILLIFGIMFVPLGILKGGLPSRRAGPPIPQTMKSGVVYSPLHFRSGPLFGLGVFLAFAGIDFVLVPAYLVFDSPPLAVAGAAIAGIGAFLAYTGLKIRKS